MQCCLRLALMVVLAAVWGNGNVLLWAQTPTDQTPNRQIPNPLEPFEFTATTISGESWELKSRPTDQKKFTVVCFLGTECPMVRQYASRLQAMADQFAKQDVEFVALFSNQQDSVEEIKKFVLEHGVRFAVIKDFDNRIADQFQAERTPEVYVLNQALRTIYQGRIDDQFAPGVAREKPTQHDLKDVLVKAIEGAEVAAAFIPATGCRIGRVRAKIADAKVTYCRDIVPVLQRNCIECHRSGEIGPFELTEYDEVIGWADTMVEVVQDGRMPPWHADPNHGSFANARRMSEEDKQVLRDWAEAGMPYGEEKDLPKESHMAELYDFKLVPDVTVKMAKVPYKVPAEGMVEYQYFVVDPGFTEDKWVAAANVTPGNRSVVHHAIVFVRPPDGSNFSGNGWLTAYVPGQRPMMPPEGYARRVPAGSSLYFKCTTPPTAFLKKI
jgi:peroxiredoxin